jgi:hypothetical protein
MQRDRFILKDYYSGSDKLSFNVSRLRVHSPASKNFEAAFGQEDLVTMLIDIEDNRLVKSVLADGVPVPFNISNSDGNIILSTGIFLEPDKYKSVELIYRDELAITVNPGADTLNFNTLINRDPDQQYLSVVTELPGEVKWSATVVSGGQNWRLNISPNNGFLNDTMMISVISAGLPVGIYSKYIKISSPDEYFYPFEIKVNLCVNPNILHQNYPNPFNSSTWIEYDLPEDGPVTLEIYNPQGQKICTILSNYQTQGSYKFEWESRNYPPGLYILLIKTRNFSEAIKMALIK